MARLNTGKSGKTIAIRADIDAKELIDKGLFYKIKIDITLGFHNWS